ncbi:MAG: M23 family metallopeptidase [Desulfovibrio sp.]|uniref:M23 family metallopeptidase n=1 Tax=Desulfovibrio sp. TaxID=885 RepID=UPI001A67A130|nr:M23 family metallopeptidase [Desulfovibrio sp.]MBD5417113.1 M23 family metallopeptidase [Desulfovibrio sp.]
MQKRVLLAIAALALLAAGFFAHKEGLLSFGEPGPAQQEATAPEAAPPAAPETTADAGAADRAVVPAIAEHGAGLPAKDAPESAPGSAPDTAADGAVTHGVVEKGDTIAKVLGNAADDGIQQYVSAARRVFSLRSFREGQPYVVVTDPDSGRVKRFEYEIDGRRRLVVEGDETPQARVEPIEYVTLLTTAEGVIDDNLFQAVADIGESPQLALRLAELFGSEVNFIRDLQEGDSFRVLVEKRYREGEYKGYGRMLAASFTNKGKTYEAFLFRDGQGRPQHYNSKGENLHKTLLQAPLAFTRLTSRFTHSRRHPILGSRRPHLGVDYAAPTGTPVKAVGEGVVMRRGWAGGYGNQIIIKHAAGLESMYAHLSGYARGLKQGQRVRQGQVIGFVGSTGLSTGPHLDFRLRQNGTFINPAKAINPRGEPVSRRNMAQFGKTVAAARDYLEGRRPLGDYTVDSLVPEAPQAEAAPPVAPQKKQVRRQPRAQKRRS